MKASGRKWWMWIWVVAAGCYPGSENGLIALRLPLRALGVEVDTASMEGWAQYATRAQPLTYDLDPASSKFFLSLGLRSADGSSAEAALSAVNYQEQTGELSLAVLVNPCRRCRFSCAIFLAESPERIETYTGETDWFDSGGIESDLSLEAWVHPVGSLRCRLANTDAQWLALRDREADLRFPRVVPGPGATGGYEALLPSLPVGRSMVVDISVDGAVSLASLRNAQKEEVTEVNLDVAGRELELFCSAGQAGF